MRNFRGDGTLMHNRTYKKMGALLLYAVLMPITGEALLWIHSYLDVSAKVPYQPNSVHVMKPDPKYVPGVSGKSVIKANSWGLRGPLPKKNDTYFVAFGSSTAECFMLDDDETWALLLMRRLNNRMQTRRAVVNIAGRRGMMVPHSYLVLEQLIEADRPLKYAILMSGTPDWSRWFHHDRYRPLTGKDTSKVFVNSVRRWQSFPTSRDDTLLDQYRKRAKTRIKRGFAALLRLYAGAEDGAGFFESRAVYLNGNRISELTPVQQAQFELGLADYRKQVERFVSLCRRHNIVPILVTQPMLYAEPLPAEYLARYHWRGNPSHRMPEPSLYWHIFQEYAAVLEDIAAAKNLVCVDLLHRMKGELDCFFDQVHFNERGAARAAEIIEKEVVSLLND